MLNRARARLAAALDPLVRALASSGISPNALTAIGFAVSAAAAYAYFSGRQLEGGLLLLASGFFDVIDGAVARASGKSSRWGGVLDSTLDRYSDLIVLGAIIAAGLCDTLIGLAAMVGSVMVSYVRAKGEIEGVKMSSVGLMERAERIVILAAASVLGYAWVAVTLLAILTHFTVAQRMWHIKKSLRS